MADTKHTPGPWTAVHGSQTMHGNGIVTDAKGKGVFGCYGADKDQAYANALIAAAAPDLLAFVQSVALAGGYDQDAVIAEAERLVAKATGGAA